MLCLLNFHQYAVVSHDLLELVSNDIATFIKSHKKLNVERRLQCNSHVFFKMQPDGLAVYWHRFTYYIIHAYTSCSAFGEGA